MKRTTAAVVNNKTIPVKAYQKKLAETKTFFSYNKQETENMTSLNKDTLEKMINEQIVQEYAEKNNITVSVDEIERRYLNVVDGYNQHNQVTSGDEQFLKKINELYGTNKSDYLIQLKNEILGEKVQIKVKMPLVKWLEEQKSRSDIKRFL